jgi:hypothetical protein
MAMALTIVPKAAKDADFSCIQYGIIDQYSSKKGTEIFMRLSEH